MIYVTGSSGFLGKHLLKALGSNVKRIPHKEIPTIKLKPFDYFYFLSTYGNMASHTDSDKIIQANVLDLIHIAKQLPRLDFKSFVFVSTSSVKLPMQTMYSRTKRMAEELLLSFIEKYKLPICVIQPFSITGVGEQGEHLIPTLIRSCLEKEMVNFVPKPCHDFIDVEDVVSGMLTLSKLSVKGMFELGSGTKYSNEEVLKIVEKVTGKKANINLVGQMRMYDNQNWVSNNYRARGYGWLPTKKLEDSIKEMYEATKK